MLILAAILSLIPSVWAEPDLDFYIQRLRYKALEVPAKREAVYKLGFKLFYDQDLSGKNNISCQSCHALSGFSGDALPLGLGEGANGIAKNRMQADGIILQRHTPAIYNTGLPGFDFLFWDGRVAKTYDDGWRTPEPLFNGKRPKLADVAATFESALAVQSIFPLVNPEEMMGKESKLNHLQGWEMVMKKIFEGRFAATYKKMFAEAFPGVTDYNIAHVGNALAELITHHFTGTNTLWDLYLRGRKDVLTERMKRGGVIFHGKAGCFRCHNGNHFTNFSFENIGIPQIGKEDLGRFAVSGRKSEMYQFRVAPLRNVGVSAPYMHSGVFKTLSEVIDHYDSPVASLRNFRWDQKLPNYRDPVNLDTDSVRLDNVERTLSPMLARNLALTPEEKKDLICFIGVALTDSSLQLELFNNGVVNEISDCSPRPMY